VVNDATWLCLAAGQGSRLRPITDDRPKTMVPVADHPLIDWLVDTAREVGLDDLAMVVGYRGDMLATRVGSDVRIYENAAYDRTDRVRALWCAESELSGTVVVSYSDILYTPTVLRTVLESPHDIAVAVDEEWRSYWERRHEDPLDDAESLSIDEGGSITSIGENVASLDAPDAQYVGLMKFSPTGVRHLRDAYESAVDSADRDEQLFGSQRSRDNIHMTDLLRGIIDAGQPVHAAAIQGGWVEVDTPDDLAVARSTKRPGEDGTLRIDR
jgi:choline kinase